MLMRKCFPENNYQEALLEDIDADQLPVYWGGTRLGEGGDPKCSKEVRMNQSMIFAQCCQSKITASKCEKSVACMWHKNAYFQLHWGGKVPEEYKKIQPEMDLTKFEMEKVGRGSVFEVEQVVVEADSIME